jgi:Baseplate J-like protein
MSASKHRARRRRPLHEGIRCATCQQQASDCRCGAFFLDPAMIHYSSDTQPFELEDVGLTARPFVEGSVSPIGGSPGTTTTPITNGVPVPPAAHPASPATSTSPLPRRRARRSVRARISAVALLGILPLSILLGVVLFFTLPAPATIAIRPSSGVRGEVVSVTAVTTTPAPLESQARVLIDTRVSSALVMRATGVVHQPAVQATGTLTFYNIAPSVQQIPAGVVFNITGGMQVISDTAVTLPAGNPPDSLGSATVPAHVQQAGVQGNITANTINGLCPCGNAGVSVKNAPFDGGQDALTYSVLTQADIDRVANPERTALLQEAKDGVKAKMRRAERLASAVICTSHEALDHQVGSKTAQAHVTVSATCQGEVYDQQDVVAQATALFRQDMRRVLQKPSVLIGSPTATITHASISDQRRGTLSFLVQVRGGWMHALDTARLSRQIAGKTYNEALSALLLTPGIVNATVQQRGSGLLRMPDDPRQITIQIVSPQMVA